MADSGAGWYTSSVVVPYALEYTTTVHGNRLRAVSCQYCPEDFAYRVSTMAIGTGESFLFLDNDAARERSGADAQRALESKLEKELRAVRCPGCRKYQPDMVEKLRFDRYIWVGAGSMLCWFGALGCVFLGLISVVLAVCATSLMIILAVGLHFTERVLRAGYDPDASPVSGSPELEVIRRGDCEPGTLRWPRDSASSV